MSIKDLELMNEIDPKISKFQDLISTVYLKCLAMTCLYMLRFL